MKHTTGITIKDFGENAKALTEAAKEMSVTFEQIKPPKITKKRRRIKKKVKVGSSVCYVESIKLNLKINENQQ